MDFNLKNDKSKISLTYGSRALLSFFSSRKIDDQKLHLASLNNISGDSDKSRERLKVKQLKHGWKIYCLSNTNYRNWWFSFTPQSIIFPTREGEFISNPNKIKKFHSYSLSYPGTASTKTIIVNCNKNQGFLIGAKPSLQWAKLSLIKTTEENFKLKLLQKNPEIYILPFKDGWEPAAKNFRNLALPHSKTRLNHKILNKPRFFLQMGIRDYFGNSYIKHFKNILPLIEIYKTKLGEGNFIHLFGTNAAGFDNMFPDFTIDKKLGGEKALKELLKHTKNLGLLSSHHFNPRIADTHWLDLHPQFKEAAVTNPSGNPWIEFYKNNIYFVMDPNHPAWQDYCLKTVLYLKNLGLDYVQLDQIAYQRNLYTKEGGFGPGYQELINRVAKHKVKFWLEGVSDVYKLPADCYSQVLPRDRPQFWETDENRRGYPYGTAFTRFYRTLMPYSPISFQIVTEKCKVNLIPKRLALAKKANAQVYDLELGFVDTTYEARLNKTLNTLTNSRSIK